MQVKAFPLIKAEADPETGSFTALASVFGNVDSVGDRMIKGAFEETLKARRLSGKPLPIVFSHSWDDPMKFIGKADPHAVFESDEGLVVQGMLDLENPIAKQVHKLMKDGLVNDWSFGYTVPKGGQKRNNGANEVSEVQLFEAGPTLKGANEQAQLQAVKSGAITVEQLVEQPEELEPDETKSAARIEGGEGEPQGPRDPLRDEIDRWRIEANRF